MSRYPAATWRPVTRYQSGSLHVPMTPRRLVLHTAVSNSDSLFGLFNTPGNPVAHFYVDEHGRVEQYVDTDFRGSANLDGNWNIIGVETWDGAGASWDPNHPGEGPRWTDAQVEALARLAVWCAKEHNIQPKALRSSRRLGTGVGFHREGIDGNFPSTWPLRGRLIGGEHWSTSTGKICPTNVRIRQTIEEVLPMARRIILGKSARPAAKPAPAPVTKDQGRVEHAQHDLHKAIKAMKPSKKRSKLQAALRLVRGVLSPKSVNRRPHEESNTNPLKEK